MSQLTLEPAWLAAFESVLARRALQPGDTAAVLSESQSRPVLVELARFAAARLGCNVFSVMLPSVFSDANLTFKRYIERPITLRIENDYVTAIEGAGVDAELMRSYIAAWGDKEAYAVSHVGYGLNRAARWDSMALCASSSNR